jgi:tape measure domain-containing protein
VSSETADFFLRLHEDVNAPAKRAHAAIRQMSGGLVAAQSDLRRTESALASFYRKQQAAPAIAREKSAKDRRGAAGTFFGALGGGLLGGTGGTVVGGLAGGQFGMLGAGAAVAAAGITSLIGIAKSAASTVLDLGASFARTTASALDFGQRSRLAFGSLIGDAGTGSRVFDEVRREAQLLGLNVRNTTDDFRLLLSAQFDVGEAKELMRAGADLQAIGTDAEHIKLALLALSQIKMKGVLQAEEMRQLVNTGVSAELIYNNLAKALGKSREEVLKMQAAREITAPMAITAFKQAILDKTHGEKLGDTGRFFANNKIGGMLGQGSAAIENWFVDLGSRITPAATRIASSVFGLFNELVSSPQLAGFADFVVAEFEGIEAWSKEHWPEIAQTVKSMFGDALEGAKDTWNNVKGLFTADNVEMMKNTLKDLPATIWLLVEPFVVLAQALSAIASFAHSFNQGNDDLGDWIGSAVGLDSKVGRGFLGYESNADRKRREGASSFSMASLGASAGQGGPGAGGRTMNIGNIAVPITVENKDVQDPQALGDTISKAVQQGVMAVLDAGA